MLKAVLQKEKRKYHILLSSGILILLMVMVVSINLGSMKISTFDVLNGHSNEIAETIFWDIRLPRILSGLIIGAGLSVSGAIFQSILRNPLADPYTIGVSTGAAFGAVLTIYINLVYNLWLPVTPMAFVFALFTLWLIMKIAGFNSVLHSSRLILAGIIVSAIFSAGISLLKSLAGEDVSAMVYWLMGRLSAKSWREVLVLLPVVGIAMVLAIASADDLDLLALGSHEARNLGVNSEKRMRFFLVLAALMTATCVAMSGVIGFVGLVIPHVIRMGFTGKHRYLLPLSAVLGGLVLILADNITRLCFTVEIPVGVLTTLIGGPFFIYIYMSRQGRKLL